MTLRCPRNGTATSQWSSPYRYTRALHHYKQNKMLSLTTCVFFFLQVISGQQLPKVNIKEDSIVDPLVRVEIHGVPMDQAKQETRYIENNGTRAG